MCSVWMQNLFQLLSVCLWCSLSLNHVGRKASTYKLAASSAPITCSKLHNISNEGAKCSLSKNRRIKVLGTLYRDTLPPIVAIYFLCSCFNVSSSCERRHFLFLFAPRLAFSCVVLVTL